MTDAPVQPEPVCPECGSDRARYCRDLNGYPAPVDADAFVFECRNHRCSKRRDSTRHGQLFSVDSAAVLDSSEFLDENDYLALMLSPLIGIVGAGAIGVVLSLVVTNPLVTLAVLISGFGLVSLGALYLIGQAVEADTPLGKGLRAIRSVFRQHRRFREKLTHGGRAGDDQAGV